tara:strand:- start:235 stop:435 length:201 start_codon:yes stop_codon:yes gene_type:complete
MVVPMVVLKDHKVHNQFLVRSLLQVVAVVVQRVMEVTLKDTVHQVVQVEEDLHKLVDQEEMETHLL